MTAHCKPDPTEYAPYHHYAEFWHGVADHDERTDLRALQNLCRNRPETSKEEVAAYTRGQEYAMRLARWVGRKEMV